MFRFLICSFSQLFLRYRPLLLSLIYRKRIKEIRQLKTHILTRCTVRTEVFIGRDQIVRPIESRAQRTPQNDRLNICDLFEKKKRIVQTSQYTVIFTHARAYDSSVARYGHFSQRTVW